MEGGMHIDHDNLLALTVPLAPAEEALCRDWRLWEIEEALSAR